MPEAAVELEIKPTRRQLLSVAGLILSAAAVASVLILLLIGGGGDLLARRTTVVTYLPDATGVASESIVRLGGIPIGKVSSFGISGRLDPQNAVRVEMRVVTRFLKSIPEDSQTSISADNLVGYPFIDISLGKSRVPLKEGGVLRSEPLQQADVRADQVRALEATFDQIDALLANVSSHESDIGKFLYGSTEYDALVTEVGDFDKGMHAFVSPRSQVGQAFYSAEVYDDIRRTILESDRALAAIQSGQGFAGTLFTSDRPYTNAVRALKDLHSQLADINAGKGAFGSLLRDDDAYRSLRATLARTDARLASLNNGEGSTGRLFRSPQLYETLNGELRELGAGLRDFQLNPKKFLRYKN